jgi:predicted MFS family arabinose efflux permease
MLEEHAAAAASDKGAPSRLTRSEWLLLMVLAAVQFTQIIDFVIIMPLGPWFQDSLRITTSQFGWLVSSYAFSASVSGLLAAWFLDHLDRKNSLLLLYAGFTIGTLLCAVAPTYLLLLAARAVAGAFAGVVGANVLAIVGDVIPLERRGRAMGVVMSAFSVASIVGVPAGLWLASASGWRAPFSALGILSLGLLGLAGFALPSLRGHLGRATEVISPWRVLLHPPHLRAYLLTAALVLGTFTIIPYLSLYLVDNVGRDKDELFAVWMCGGVATLLTMTPFGWLSDRFGRLRVFRVVVLSTLVPTLVLTNLPRASLVPTLLVTTVFMMCTSARWVPAMAMITASTQPRYRGGFMSINASVQQLTAAVAPLLAALILGDTNEGVPLAHFGLVGLVAVTAMVASLYLAGRLQVAEGEAGVGPVPQPVLLPLTVTEEARDAI